jgi:hypothetical protein
MKIRNKSSSAEFQQAFSISSNDDDDDDDDDNNNNYSIPLLRCSPTARGYDR